MTSEDTNNTSTQDKNKKRSIGEIVENATRGEHKQGRLRATPIRVIPQKRAYQSRRFHSTASSSEQQVIPTPRQKRSKSKEVPAAIGGQSIPTSASRLSTPIYCSKCGAKKFAFEPPSFCCSGGEVQIATNDTPTELIRLFTSRDEEAMHFRQYARLYNNLFAFSSLGGTYDAQTKKGIYVFKLHGQIYHFVPNLLPNDHKPKYLQLYFYDSEHEKEHRVGVYPELRDNIISILMNIMTENPYAKFFRSLKEFDIEEDTKIIINRNSVPDQRTYNAPTAEEVAAIWLDNSSSVEHGSPHIEVFGKSNQSHRIMHYYGCYDPLQYPLIYPRGDCGWHQGLKKRGHGNQRQSANPIFPIIPSVIQSPEDLILDEDRATRRKAGKQDKQVSCREYYAYKLQIRSGNFLLRSGRLFQQFIVDMYVKIENTRLDFLRKNQETIRADLYQGILDSLGTGEKDASNIGHRVVLPPSFIGGPRDMRRRYLNAMTLVQKYGKPDLFLTMTCNPNWFEIKEELIPGEKVQDRPDIVARVFHAKLVALKKEIMEKKVFGDVAAMIHVIEFQKRGLPHAHFLIILKPECKIKNPEDYDKFVSAELPSVENPHLRAAVVRHMMHGPCGVQHPDCPCMKQKGLKKACKSGYPKKFAEFTTNGNDSYPIYRRRNTGETVSVRRANMDNRWVIPYNSYLLAMFDCHLNVEVCSTIKAVKYLYKYVYKGHDCISFNLVQAGNKNMNDEIEKFQSGRWVSPPEAAWRIFGFQLYDMFPTVVPLQIHMPDMHFVQFRPHEDIQSIVADKRRSKTMLTEYFKINYERVEGPKYLYSEFPEHFVWDDTKKEWKDRKKGIAVGRLVCAAPVEGERYHLRLLLAHVPGPRSFEDMLTVGGYKCATFQESALMRGLLEQDNSIEQCMNEGIEVQMPHALRRLFSTLLIFCQPSNPRGLWEKYYESLSEDYRHKYPNDSTKVLQLTAQKVEQFLEGMSKSLSDFNLDHLRTLQDQTLRKTRDIVDALHAPVPLRYVNARKELNKEQRTAYKCIMNRIKTGESGAFFIDGPGGTGKTYLYCALYAKVRMMGKIVLPTATSGIAASNIPTGRTAHSRFKIPLDNNSSLTCGVSKQSGLAALLQHASLIIWDEASMAKKENIEALDLLLRDLCTANKPFGGKVVVFGGDFRQVLPVLPRKTQQEAVDASLVSSYLWPILKKFKLTENIRAIEDPVFSNFLLKLGNGELQKEGDKSDLVSLPSELMIPFQDDSFQELVKCVFPEIEQPFFDPEIFTERAILTPKNDDVDTINKVLIDQFPGESFVYKGYDSVLDDSCNNYPNEFLNTLCPGGMSPFELILKENCPVILLRNLDPAAGLCNGTRLVCKKFFPNMIQCQIATGCYKGEHVFLPRIILRPSASSKYPFQFQRKQFPIKLSFAMTVNKAQGQTLQQVGIYLQHPCFSHGQLYVALSRARKANQLTVLAKPPPQQPNSTSLVKNVVSFEILRRAEII